MSKKLKLLLSIFVIVYFFIPKVNADGFSGSGSGTQGNPYIITNCTQLQEMNLDLTSYFKLDGPSGTINCSATSGWNSDGEGGYYGFKPIGDITTPFAGNLDGNNNVITGLYINRPSENFVGLFSTIDVGSSISNFGLTGVNITGLSNVGAVAGGLSGTATKVYSKGQVHGASNHVGGLVGTHVNNNSWNNSSPLVYTWNGNKYTYVADVGNLLPNEVKNAPDLATIDRADLVPKDGKYSMKISEEYNEIVYYDELSLSTYDHALGYVVAVPLNRTSTANDVKTVSETPTNPLLSCTDSFGNDCTDALKANDDKWAYQDKSFVNSYILDFGDLSGKSSIQLVSRMARDYKASAQKRADGTYQSVRTVQVKNAQGNWVEIYNKSDLGSDGTPRLRTIDLSGKFLTNDYHVKVGFDTMNVNYFAIDTTPQVPVTVNTYHPTKANLSFRGFTEMTYDHYYKHDYDKVSDIPQGIFKGQYGNFTKYGDVSPLLDSSNDQFVIMHSGDHMDIEFPYNAPQEGQVRDYILNNNVWYKHASNDGIGLLGKTVNPLPYNGMTEYTSNTNGYPMTQENIDYLNTWNTRIIEGIPQVDKVAGSTIINSYSEANVSGNYYVGGLVGYNEKEIRGSYATGNVSSTNCTSGGLVGENGNQGSTGWIHDSYAKGNVSGQCNVGGLIGYNWANIERSYSTGQVSGSSGAHGLVGYSWNGSITDSFWDTQTSGTNVQYIATGKTTSEMKNVATFTNTSTSAGLVNAWDFVGNPNNDTGNSNIWNINQSINNGYPFLVWQNENITTPTPTSSHHSGGSSVSSRIHNLISIGNITLAQQLASQFNIATPTVSQTTSVPGCPTSMICTPISATTTVSTSTATITKDLFYGMDDVQVTTLQNILHNLSLLTATPNGHFGPATLKAVKNYQKSKSLPTTGYVGPRTRGELNK